MLFYYSPEKDVVDFEGEDTCGSSSWESQFVTPDEGNNRNMMRVILPLKAYTTYAFLVRSYMISSTNYGAKSEIMYIQTWEDCKCYVNSCSHYYNIHKQLRHR